ncbi:MAG: 3'(2'),5'-bisphosphate nucleotidase CysQ [Gammaproteobacteria bacterium]|nr:3'(2'),5'-bisphosphate nucleotidase CysQ [Gammaproteobacteria bacterium]
MIDVTLELLEEVSNIGWHAAQAVLEIYQGEIAWSEKADHTPLTQADLISHYLIMDRLRTLFPDIAIISEEDVAEKGKPWSPPHQFWLVDPLDGTKEFINRIGEFTINIALIEAGEPVLGVVCAPAFNTLYTGLRNVGAFKNSKSGEQEQIRVKANSTDQLHVVSSRFHQDQAALATYLEKLNIASFKTVGSSLKFCTIAEGRAQLYPRFGRTMEWDTAAGHAVLAAAGGEVILFNGNLMHYGKKDFENPPFIAKPRELELTGQLYTQR